MNLYPDRVISKNYKLLRAIYYLDELHDMMNRGDKSVFVRHRIYPIAFIQNWHFRDICLLIKNRQIWIITPIN